VSLVPAPEAGQVQSLGSGRIEQWLMLCD